MASPPHFHQTRIQMTNRYPNELLALIAHLKRLPGVGSKTAERFAFALLKWPKEQLQGFGQLVTKLKEALIQCEYCSSFKVDNLCPFCNSEKRDGSQICIISSPKDLFSLEETRIYIGLYHVLDGLLSPYNIASQQTFDLSKLKKQIEHFAVKEIIIALDSTIEGDTTALIVKRELQKIGSFKISRLAFGVPLGSSLEFVDGGTLAKALTGRQNF